VLLLHIVRFDLRFDHDRADRAIELRERAFGLRPRPLSHNGTI
jgi:hypothetical protein